MGTIRTIYGAYQSLPIGQFERLDDTDPDPVCELSSLVVDPAQRSTGVIEHLYRAGWLDAWRSRSHAAVALIDDWLLDVFQGTYHLPFRRIGVEREYMGTVPIPVALPLDGDAYRSLAASNPEFWAWTLEAIDADEVVDWTASLTMPELTLDYVFVALMGGGYPMEFGDRLAISGRGEIAVDDFLDNFAESHVEHSNALQCHLRDGTPYLVGLDTDCVYGGELTAWILEEDRIVQVAGQKAIETGPPVASG